MAYIRKRGENYQITVSNGRRLDGTKITETATFRPDPAKTEKQNKKALEKFVYDFEERVKNGTYMDGEKLSFGEFAETWMQEYAEAQLEAGTVNMYKHLLRVHILPELGHMKLSKILPAHLNKLYKKLSQERKDGKPGGYAPKTVKHIHTVISAIYATAVKWGVAAGNPAERADPPKQIDTRDSIKFFDLEQTKIFLSLLDKDYTATYRAHDRTDDTGKVYHVADYSETRRIPTQFKLFFLLALFCGCRRGELIALTWKDFDLATGALNITKSTTIVDGKPLTKSPKTKSSVRMVSVPASVVAVAKEYKREQMEYRMAIGSQWIGEDYIFIQWNGKQMYPDTPYNVFKKIIKRHNASCPDETQQLPEISLHGLRHTSATLLISQNVDVKTVSGRLGHAQTSTTMDIYAHSLRKMDEKAADTLGDLLAENMA